MKHQFTLPAFPDSNFEMEISIWTGKQTLYNNLKYLKAIGVTIAAFAIYFLVSAVVWGGLTK